MTTEDPTDLAQAHAEIARLQAEIEQLRAQLQRARPRRGQSIEALKFGGSFLVPMLDRQRVFRTFVAFFDEASYYTLPQDNWPPRERVLERARDFGLAVLRFFVKRRLAVFMFSLLAFFVPLVQIWLVFQQNAIIENQNKYFNIQVYDIVARSLTGGDTTAKQITSALLAREDFGLVNGIIRSVFESETGGAFTEEDAAGGRPLFLEETAARGHLVSALGQALETQSDESRFSVIWSNVERTYGLVARDAANRVPQLVRISRTAAFDDPRVGEECYRYLFSLSSLFRRSYALSLAVGEEDVFFQGIAPMVGRLSSAMLDGSDQPFRSVFVTAFHEVLVDLAQKPKFGRPAPAVEGSIENLIRAGFKILVQRTKASGVSIDDGRLKKFLEVP